MRVAELQIITAAVMTNAAITVIGFDNAAAARAEFERLKAYINARDNRNNDVEVTITVEGINSFVTSGKNILGVEFLDYAKENAARSGFQETFPNIARR